MKEDVWVLLVSGYYQVSGEVNFLTTFKRHLEAIFAVIHIDMTASSYESIGNGNFVRGPWNR